MLARESDTSPILEAVAVKNIKNITHSRIQPLCHPHFNRYVNMYVDAMPIVVIAPGLP